MTSTVLELVGMALVAAGLAVWSVPLCLVVVGLALIAAGYQLDVPTTTRRPEGQHR